MHLIVLNSPKYIGNKFKFFKNKEILTRLLEQNKTPVLKLYTMMSSKQ